MTDNFFADNSHIHDGHRQRMKAKMLAHGSRIFDTYELLEMLLYYSVPYSDTNPISKRLLSAFGSLDGVLKSAPEALQTVSGIGEKSAGLISMVGKLSYILGAEPAPSESLVFSEYSRVGEHFVRFFGNTKSNAVAIMLLDNGMKLIATEKICRSDFSSASIKSAPFVSSAIKHGASVAITAHTHPHGPLYPSEGDKATCDMITRALEAVGVVHIEHFVVSGTGYIGFMGVLPRRMDRYTDELQSFLVGQCRAIDKVSSAPELSDSKDDFLDLNISALGYEDYIKEYFLSLSERALGKRARASAESLFERYSSIEGVISADTNILVSTVGERAAMFYKLLAYLSTRRVTDEFEFGKAHVMRDYECYFKALFLGTANEAVYAMLIDGRGRAISCPFISEGTVNSSDVAPRRIVEVATRAAAASVILVHSHPCGTTEPSREDISFTSRMMGVLSSVGIRLAGHYIVAGQYCKPIAPVSALF